MYYYIIKMEIKPIFKFYKTLFIKFKYRSNYKINFKTMFSFIYFIRNNGNNKKNYNI